MSNPIIIDREHAHCLMLVWEAAHRAGTINPDNPSEKMLFDRGKQLLGDVCYRARGRPQLVIPYQPNNEHTP